MLGSDREATLPSARRPGVAVNSDRLGAEATGAVVATWAVGPGVLRGKDQLLFLRLLLVVTASSRVAGHDAPLGVQVDAGRSSPRSLALRRGS